MEKANEWKEKGTACYKALQFDEAIKYYEHAASLCPQDPGT